MKRLVFNLLTLIIVGLAVLNVSEAYFSDREASVGNVLAAGTLDLKIDNTSYYNGATSSGTTWDFADLDNGDGPANGKYLFFNFNDLKPGDDGEDTVSIHVDDNPAWACVTLDLTKNDDNGTNEPELGSGDSADVEGDLFDGELAQNLNFVFWTDDGDNVLETGEKILTTGPASSVLNSVTFPLADSLVNNVGEADGQPLDPTKTYYIGKAWCFGQLTTAPLTQDGSGNARTPIGPEGPGVTCDGSSLDNKTQTDLVMGDVKFEAIQARSLPNFTCGEAPPPVACEETYVSQVISSTQGTLNNGSAITDPTRTNPANTLGAPNSAFWSIGKNGTITLAFASPVSNVAGYDLTLNVHEITNGRDTYPEERAQVFVSDDNSTYYSVGFATSEPGGGGDGITLIDAASSPLSSFRYVRLTDNTTWALHGPTADGYDLDAVKGNCRKVE